MDSDKDLERLIDRELARLPAPHAPRTLAPRILLAVRNEVPAPRHVVSGWFTWPLAWQASSLAAMVLLLAGAMNAWPVAAWAVAAMSSYAAGEVTWVGDLLRQGANLIGAAGVVWRVLVEPVVMVLAVFLAAMCAASAAFGAALRSVVLGGTSRP